MHCYVHLEFRKIYTPELSRESLGRIPPPTCKCSPGHLISMLILVIDFLRSPQSVVFIYYNPFIVLLRPIHSYILTYVLTHNHDSDHTNTTLFPPRPPQSSCVERSCHYNHIYCHTQGGPQEDMFPGVYLSL